ncbi:MAG: hypothetical protein ACRDLA_03615 [Thermoleophilaceae bacterium]
MTTPQEPGPGLTWLAARVGCTPEDLLADPRRLVKELADAERAISGLTLRLRSDDVAVRTDAEREADRLRRIFVEAPPPGTRFGATVLRALRDAADRVRSARGDGGGEGAGDSGRPDDPTPPESKPRR